MRWLDEVIEALKALGGIASYSQIYDYIEKNTHRNLTKNWKATVRKTIEDHSSDSKNFRGEDIFYSVEGLGKGIWGLREMLTETPRTEDIGVVEDKTELPEKVKSEIYRVLRDTSLTKRIKQLYKNRCQICGITIKLKNGKEYSEAHHIKPIGKHNGPDSADNIVILCPNHHVEFDYGVIAIEPKTFRILHKDPENPFIGKRIELHPEHKLNEDYLEYHMENIYKA